MTTQRIVEELYAAMASGDNARAVALMAPNVRHTVYSAGQGAPFAGDFSGRDAVARHFDEIGMLWDLETLQLDELAIDGDRAAVRVEAMARHKFGLHRIRTDATHYLTVGPDGLSEFEVFFHEGDAIERAAPRELVDAD